MDLKTFIERAKTIHNNEYDYSLTNFVNKITKVKIICNVHGVFEQSPINHLKGHKCKECSNLKKKTTKEEFIRKSILKHGNVYDYSLINEYVNTSEKVKIICPIHGEFEQRAGNHIHQNDCKKCAFNKQKLTQEEFIFKCKELHGEKYNYSLINYKTYNDKIKIMCRIHGEFEQFPNNHIKGSGCYHCSVNNRRITTKEFIQRAILTHGDKFDYSKVEYDKMHKKVQIICSKHGIFKQTPHGHLKGNGCHRCMSSSGEILIKNILKENNIKFIDQHKFEDCRNKKKLPFDFYLPDYNTCIEFNGLQHYEPLDFFGGDEGFIYRQKNDEIKITYCEENNINLIIVKYNESVDKIKKIWEENLKN